MSMIVKLFPSFHDSWKVFVLIILHTATENHLETGWIKVIANLAFILRKALTLFVCRRPLGFVILLNVIDFNLKYIFGMF